MASADNRSSAVAEEPPTWPKALAWALLLAFMVIANLAQSAYHLSGAEPSSRFQLLTFVGSWMFLWYWFSSQVAPYHPRFPLDTGVFIVVFWVVLMPYYLWRFERWRGLLKIAAVFAAYLAAWLLGFLVYLLLR